MSQRTVRLNQLLLQEFSAELHSRWRTEAVRITLTGFDISPDLRNAVLYYAVLGGTDERKNAAKLLKRVLNTLKAEVFKRVPIKYTPDIRFIYDNSSERGVKLVSVLDEIAHQDEERERKIAARTAKTATLPPQEQSKP